MSTMSHKGYSARVDYDDDDGIFFGRIAGINDVIGFHADTVDGLRAAFHEAVDDYIAACAKIGKEPEKAYSGKVMFRLEPEMHARIAKAAELSGMSLNQWGEKALGGALNREREDA